MGKANIEFLDFAKGFAILSIVIFHYWQPYTSGLWATAIMLGGSGVHLFFLLSGFGLGLSASKSRPLYFYRKRFTKILVPYYAAITFIFIVNGICHFYGKNSLYAICGHFFLYKMFDEHIIGSYGYHFWFISTIVQFYIFFPIIMRIRESLSAKHFLIISFSISIVYWILISLLNVSQLRIYNSFFLQYLWEFNLGIVLAENYAKKGNFFWDQSLYILFPAAILCISVMAAMAAKGGTAGRIFNDIPASLGYTCLTATLYISLAKAKNIRSLIIYAGKISYELYLMHMILFLLTTKIITDLAGIKGNIFLATFIILPISILISKCFSETLHLVSAKIQTGNISKYT